VINGTIPWPSPSVLGHEGAGVVEAVGESVSRVKPGDHIVVATLANCGKCKWCNTGKPFYCRSSMGNITQPFTYKGEPATNFAGTSSFAERTLIKEIQAVPISKDVPLTSAALLACGVVTGTGAVLNKAKVQPGQTAAVFGVGGVGLNCIQALALSNASRIIAIDTLANKEALALQFGATDFINAADVDTGTAVRELLPGAGPFGDGGVDWSFECVGHPAVLRTALDILDWGGTCVAVGVPAPGVELNIPITHMIHVERGLIGCRAGSVRPQHDIPLLAQLYLDGKLKLDELVTQTYPLSDFEQVTEDMEAGKLARGVLTF
jgi:S-(hydroxymethyl)glutathione dehydrogenase/alcohol dehydrogenase